MRKGRLSGPLLILAAPGAALAAEEEALVLQTPGQAQSGMKPLPAEELRDIHGPVTLAGQPPWWAVGAVIVALLVLFAAVFLFLKKRRRPPAPPPSPWETALAELAAAKKLQHQALLYVERVSEILRRYIESRFSIRSTRQTTREFLAGLSQSGEHSPLAPFRQELQICLEQADLAKFARLVPGPDHMAEMERAAADFVKKTEPPPGPPLAPRKEGRLKGGRR